MIPRRLLLLLTAVVAPAAWPSVMHAQSMPTETFSSAAMPIAGQPGPKAQAPGFGAMGAPGVDHRITNSTQPQNETTIISDPNNPNVVIGGWNDYRLGTGRGGNGVGNSTDGGVTWTDRWAAIPLPAGFTLNGGDPGLGFNSAGRAFYTFIAGGNSALSIDDPRFNFTRSNGVFIANSTNGGVSWSGATAIASNVYSGTDVPFEDKMFTNADHYASSPFRDRVYASWTRFYPGAHPNGGTYGGDIFVGRSTDNGATWTNVRVTTLALEPGNVGTGSVGTTYVQGSEPEVEADGDVYLAYWFGGRIHVTRSTDGGVSWGQPISPTGFGGASIPSPLPNESFRVNPYPNIETDPTRPNQVYVVWPNDDDTPTSADAANIFFARSTDNGLTWGPPVKLNDDGLDRNQFFPWMAVNAAGDIIVMWYDTRNDPGNHRLDVYSTISQDGGITWSPNQRVTDASFEPNTGEFNNNAFFGDYNGAAADDGNGFHMLWTDTRTGGSAEQEIYYDRKIPPNPIAVTYPNGGETLVVLCGYTITWTAPGSIPTVNIDYSTDGGSHWVPIVSGTENDGSYVWSVPGFTTTQGLMRVSGGSHTDVSDAYFTIAVVPPAVTYPNGGEVLTAGGTANITWTAPACLSTVSLAYSTTGSSPWWSIVSSTPNDGSYSWTIPATPTTQARVQVYAGAGIDPSNGPFTIQGVGVTYPNNAEYLPSGTVATITWASVNAGANANIDYSTDGGSTWTPIVSGTPNDGAFDWTVPAIATTQGRVRVSSGAYSDISDFNFNIVVPSTAWVPDGVMLKFRQADEIQYARTVTDGLGGAFVSWKRIYGANLGLYVNRVTGAGAMPSPWPFGGKKIATTDGTNWQPHHAVADGSGGLYAGFNTSGNALVQHATSNGDVQVGWPVDGVVLGPGSRSTRVSPDGSGGVYAAWIASDGVRLQRLTSSGAPASGWPTNGVLVGAGSFFSVDVVGDGTAGAYVAWEGFVHRITSGGVKDPAWPVNGLAIPSHYPVRIVGDGAGGAVVSYIGATSTELKATRVQSNATFFPGWTSAGVTISTELWLYHVFNYYDMVADGTGGALLAFSAANGSFMKVQRITGTGAFAPGWPSGGALLSSYSSSLKASPSLINDGNGGCVATWQELRNGTGCEGQPNFEGCDWDIFSGHVAHSGIVDPTFATNGTVISALLTTQAFPFLTSASAGEGIVAWQDNRPTNYFCIACEAGVFAQQVPFDAVPPAAVSLSAASGCSDVTLSWLAPGDDGSTGTASLYDLRASTSPINEGSFLSAAQIASFAPTGPAGTPQSFVHSVGACAPAYYYALKTRDDSGNWSAISNVPNGQATCCGGGGGCPIVFAHGPGGWTRENSILGRSLDGRFVRDLYRVKSAVMAEGGVYRMMIREDEEETTTLDQVRLDAADHDASLRAFSVEGRPMIGSVTPAARVTTESGADVTGLINGSTAGSMYLGTPADVLYLEFPAARSLAAKSPAVKSQATSPERIIVIDIFKKEMESIATLEPTSRVSDARILSETGVKLEYEDQAGAWHSVHRYPREDLDNLAFEVPVASRYRLVLVGSHTLAFAGCIDAAVPAPENVRTLLSAHHSQLGDVTEALLKADGRSIKLRRGEQLELNFQASTPSSGEARDLFLASTGVYSSDPSNMDSSPAVVSLSQNQPNPFGSMTEITFALPRASDVRLEIFDLQGRSVTVLAAGKYPAGTYSLHWDGLDAAKSRVRPGLYLYRLRAAGTEIQRRMILLP
jgi:flagellar hook capping protein FlgD